MACMKLCPLVSLTHLHAGHLYQCAAEWHPFICLKRHQCDISASCNTSLCLLLLSLIKLTKYLSCTAVEYKTEKGENVAVWRCSTIRYFCPCRKGREQRCACPCFPVDLKQNLRWKARVRMSCSVQGPGHFSYQVQVFFFFNILIPAIQK